MLEFNDDFKSKNLIDQDNEYYRKFTKGLDCNFYVYKGNTKEEQHQEMLERRNSTIGASDVGKIMNSSPYGCSTLVYMDKKGLLPPKEESWPLLRGSALEPVVIKLLQKKHPQLEILEGNKIVCVDKEYDFMQCNVDGIITHPDGTREGLEVKNISPYNRDKWDSGSVPDDYYAQCQYSMMITGLDKWRLAVSFDCEPIEYFVERDDDFITDISIAVLNFKMMLDNNQMPPVDTDYYNEETFQAVHPEGFKQKDKIIASKEIGLTLLKINNINSKIKEMQAEVDYLKPLAEFYCGDKDGTLYYEGEIEEDGELKNIKVSARMQTSQPKPKFSVNLMKEKYPDIYSQIETDCITTGKPSRSFGWLKVISCI